MTDGKHIVIDARIRRSSTGRYVDRLLKYLQEIDTKNKYTILLEKGDDWEPTADNFHISRIRVKQFSFNPIEQIIFPLKLYMLRPDLVHFTMTQQPILYFGNIVTTTHDLSMLKYTHQKLNPRWLHAIKQAGYLFLMWWGHHKSKRIIVPTYSVKKQLVAHQGFTLPKIDVTYEAGELPEIKAAVKPDFLESNEDYICFVGTAFPHKNGEGLVKAFEKLTAKHRGLKLIFVGKKDFFYEKLEEFARGRGQSTKNIVFSGFISTEELVWVYKHALVYVFPTLSEGFGLPGLEAMSHGLPVAASNIPVLKEVYGDAAVYFDPSNPYDIAKTVDKPLTDRNLREALVQKGYEQIKKYSWKRMAEETLAVYGKCFRIR